MSSTENGWPAVEWNLQRARGEWGRLTKIFGREGAYNRIVGRLYETVVQAVLLFGSKTRVLTPRLEKSLEGFHHGVAHQMAGMVPNYQPDGT